MTLTSKIRNQIEQFSFGQTFGYKDLNIDKQEFQAAAKALERLQKDGLIKFHQFFNWSLEERIDPIESFDSL